MVLYERNPHAGRHSAAGEGTHTRDLKNAVLPILAATLLTNEVSYIQNCPTYCRMYTRFVHLLTGTGMSGALAGEWDPGTAGRQMKTCPARERRPDGCSGEAITGMRSSLCLLGALLGKMWLCDHGASGWVHHRRTDRSICTFRALQQMGVEFREEEGLLSAQVKDGKTARGRDHTGVSQVWELRRIFCWLR